MELTKDIKDKVLKLLESVPTLRDNDLRLIANIWAQEVGGKEKTTKMTADEFLRLYTQGKLTNPESIRRIRQKVQEEHEELRGSLYEQRQKHANTISRTIKS